MDAFLTLMCIASALIVIATLVTYEHLLREARRERDRAIEHASQAQSLLTAVSRHPSVRPIPGLTLVRTVVDSGQR